MLDEQAEKSVRARFYVSCNCSCKLYFLVKIQLACMNLSYGTT